MNAGESQKSKTKVLANSLSSAKS